MEYEIKTGDCIDVMKTMPDECVDTIITSPPYWGLRDYGTATWEGGDPDCSHKRDSKHSESCGTGQKNLEGAIGDGIYETVCKRCGAIRKDRQIGLEETPEEYVQRSISVIVMLAVVVVLHTAKTARFRRVISTQVCNTVRLRVRLRA